MSKMGDYFEQKKKNRAKAQEKREKQTVADFAKKFNRSPDSVLSQLREAGIQKNSEFDGITDFDMQAMLHFLHTKNGKNFPQPEKKIAINEVVIPQASDEDQLLKAVLAQANGAEWDYLNQFTTMVLAGENIAPVVQTIVNLIIAKAIITDALPAKKQGRPVSKEAEILGKKLARNYWDLRDKGISYQEVVSQVAEKFHKDERTITRLAEKYKKSTGLTLEERELNREYSDLRLKFNEKMCINQPITPPTSALQSAFLSLLLYEPPEFTVEECIAHLNEQIMKNANQNS